MDFPFFDLLQCFFCGAMKLELHYINVVRCLQHKVDTAIVGVVFHLGVEASIKGEEGRIKRPILLTKRHFTNTAHIKSKWNFHSLKQSH